ncbi:MAG: P-type DNA transfer protein VirB5 [Legionellales bacterium]|nr:P-type DNA transfer protein VirB5 [Legionellales bacterium]
MMKKLFGGMLLLFVGWASIAFAMLPVFDASAVMKAAEEVAELKNQIAILQNEYQQIQTTYHSMTGNRGMGNLYVNPTFQNALPDQWQTVYRNGTPISEQAQHILQEEANTIQGMNVSDAQHYIQQRQLQTAADNKAMGEMAYQGMMSRLNNIESLLASINKTQDPKDIAELQARIASEQAIVQNEQTKLTLMQNLQRSEQQLIDEQQDQLSNKILNPNNTVLPHLPND